MSFGHPILLLALLAVPLAVALYWLAERRRMRYAVAFTNIGVLASVAGGRSWRRLVPLVLFLLALTALCVAVARPSRATLVTQDKATVILVIDASRSMQANDVKPTRLAAAQHAVLTFLDRAPKKLRVGLIVFSGEAQVAAPPTTDHRLVRQAVGDIGFFEGFGGTAIGDALAAAVEVGQAAVGESSKPATIAYYPHGSPIGSKKQSLVSILFLSDGKQTRGALSPDEGAQRAKAAGFPVYTVALGTPHGTLRDDFGGGPGGGGPGFFPPGGGGFGGRIPVAPDPTTLHRIANTTGGKFYAAKSAGAVEAAYKQLGSKLGRRPARHEITYEFLALAALLLVAAGVASAAWSPRFP